VSLCEKQKTFSPDSFGLGAYECGIRFGGSALISADAVMCPCRKDILKIYNERRTDEKNVGEGKGITQEGVC
jgi:cephalosporin hydroxylase